MRIGRTLPPSAAPLGWRDICHGVAGLFAGAQVTDALAAEIRREFGVDCVFFLASGKAALRLTLSAISSLSPRKRNVVIPAFTCFSVPAAVLQAGLRPVVCDIDANTFDFDYEQLARVIDENTLCVVAHHLFGIPAAIDRVHALCRPCGVVVIEDAAQAMGVESGGRLLGTSGDAGIFSLGRGKHLTCGSGGIVVAQRGPVADAIQREYQQVPEPSLGRQVIDLLKVLLMAVFIRPSLYWIPSALPFLRLGQTIFPRHIPVTRLGGMKAGVLRGWRTRLERANRVRTEATTYFSERLGIPLPAGTAHPYLRVPLVANTASHKETVCAIARRRGLGIGVAYPSPIDDIPEVRAVCNDDRFPTARRIADNLLTLPTHHFVSERDRRAIADLCTALTAA